MKAKTWLVFMILFTAVIYMRGVEVKAETESLERWDLTQEYTLTKDDVKYYAYLTKDGKESWIYKAELLNKKKKIDVVLPKKIQGAPVTCVGMTHELSWIWHEKEKNWCEYYNLFFYTFEPHSDYGGEPAPLVTNVRSIILPNSVKVVGTAVFACMSNLEYVHLSNMVKIFPNFLFYGCRDLQRIDFPPKVEVPPNCKALSYCDGLKGLMEEIEFRHEGMTIIGKGNLLINQSEKTLIQVMPTAKSITIPNSIRGIEPSAFYGSNLKKIKVSKKHKYFAVHRNCLYNKKNGKLILVFGKKRIVNMSKKVKIIDENVMVTKYKIKKLYIPRKIVKKSGWKKPFISNNKKIKIYYRGKRIR